MNPIDKFKNLPAAGNDTQILYQNLKNLAGYDVIFDTWCWEGFTASSVIFYSKDVAHLSEAAIKALVKNSGVMETGSDLTYRETAEGYTFVNFNFHHEDMD